MQSISLSSDDSRQQLSDMLSWQARHTGLGLAAYFYQSNRVYQHELERLIFNSWICAGHVSQIPKAGDYFLFDIDSESIIIARDAQQQVHALLNNCRHRGSRVCTEPSGHRKSLVCPYHGWVYELDGRLKSARQMDMLSQFDQQSFGLKKAQLEIHHGLIFINCDPSAPSLASDVAAIQTPLAAHELDNCKVAAVRNYSVDANWKLAVENYLECYHCATAHRSYAKMHTIKDLEVNVAEEQAKLEARCEARTGVPGIAQLHYKVYCHSNHPGGGTECSRYALYPGFVTGSKDGQALAPLLGKLKDYDGGLADFQFGPLSFLIVYPDHGVLYRFVPRGQNLTDMTLWWLVRGEAEEGKDYELGKLTWLWEKTTQEDKTIITHNSEGVNSRFYQPGPYHPEFEYACLDFVAWYLNQMQTTAGEPHVQ